MKIDNVKQYEAVVNIKPVPVICIGAEDKVLVPNPYVEYAFRHIMWEINQIISNAKAKENHPNPFIGTNSIHDFLAFNSYYKWTTGDMTYSFSAELGKCGGPIRIVLKTEYPGRTAQSYSFDDSHNAILKEMEKLEKTGDNPFRNEYFNYYFRTEPMWSKYIIPDKPYKWEPFTVDKNDPDFVTCSVCGERFINENHEGGIAEYLQSIEGGIIDKIIGLTYGGKKYSDKNSHKWRMMDHFHKEHYQLAVSPKGILGTEELIIE